MQMAAYYQYSQPLATKQAQVDTLRSSVTHLLTRAQSLPCNTAAQSFTQLVPPISRFQLALDVVLPLLDSSVDVSTLLVVHRPTLTLGLLKQLSQRILASYILYALYAPHPITINPFHSALLLTFNKERETATQITADGGIGPNEQLVWVLWKILKGKGDDVRTLCLTRESCLEKIAFVDRTVQSHQPCDLSCAAHPARDQFVPR